MYGELNNQLFQGIMVIEDPYATTSEPVRKHKLTRQQLKHLTKHMFKGITYHDRIQKKWNKRFGFKQVPGMYKMKDPRTCEDVFVCHPVVMKALKEYKYKPPHLNDNDDTFDLLKRQAKERKELKMIVGISWITPLVVSPYKSNSIINMNCSV